MKIDVVSIIQLSIFVLFLMTILTYAVSSYRSRFNSLSKGMIDNIYLLKMDYTKKLNIVEYVAFEKYGVWRYLARF